MNRETSLANQPASKKFNIEPWSGRLYWNQNEETIWPLATESGNIIWRSVSAKIHFSDDIRFIISNKIKASFWYQECVKRILQKYEQSKRNMGEEQIWYSAKIEFGDSAFKEYFLNFLETGFDVLMLDTTTTTMILHYDHQVKEFQILIPTDQKIFHMAFFIHLHVYFVTNFDFLHGKQLNKDLLLEAEKRAVSRIRKMENAIAILKEVELELLESKGTLKWNLIHSIMAKIPHDKEN